MSAPQRRHRGGMVWRCPTCGRRVPHDHEQCACGYLKAWRPSMVVDTSRRGGSTRTQILIVGLILAAAMLAMLTLLR